MKEKLSLHITKRSEHVLQWSKAIFLKFLHFSMIFSKRKRAYGIESIHSMISSLNLSLCIQHFEYSLIILEECSSFLILM